MIIKICGITNLEDALVAIDAGADLLGFNFYHKSPRFITPDAAQEIIKKLPPTIGNVGVFVNEDSPKDVTRLAKSAGVSIVQLHGNEPASYCSQLKNEFKVIKALRVGDDFTTEYASSFNVDWVLLDAFSTSAYGGTGHTFNWSIARQTRDLLPNIFLAGGLTLDNIKEAVKTVDPYGIDVCSGVEQIPGKKDSSRMRQFISTVKKLAS
jgi:phosphoribosylanthranilate isomerase